MLSRNRRLPSASRPGAATVEFAVLLPLLCVFFVIGADFARFYATHLTATSCARSGALYGSADYDHATDTEGIREMALADATNMNPQPTVTSRTTTGTDGNTYVEVSVAYQFDLITRFPGFPERFELTRTVTMRVAPDAPND